MKGYLRRVCVNVLFVTLLAVTVPSLVYAHMSDGIMRFGVMCILTTMCSSMSIYFGGCSVNERRFVRERFLFVLKRLSL